MKKTILTILIIAAVLFSVCQCYFYRVRIQDYEWELKFVYYMYNNSGMKCIAVSKSEAHKDIYDGLDVFDVTLVAKKGGIAMTDHVENKTYKGRYTILQKDLTGIEYEVTIGDKEGEATTLKFTVKNEEEPRLIIKIGVYSYWFHVKQK